MLPHTDFLTGKEQHTSREAHTVHTHMLTREVANETDFIKTVDSSLV